MPYTQVDLSALAVPQVLETVDYEDILARLKASVAEVYPPIAPVLELESETAVKVLQVCAVYIMLTRARVNDGARALILAYATGSDLDQIGAMFGVERKLLTPETDTSAAVYEGDAEFRARIQLSFEGFSVAGPRGAYEFHALSSHADIRHGPRLCAWPGR